jgi:ATP-dependent Clp protease ATP-binding subunit ClpA
MPRSLITMAPDRTMMLLDTTSSMELQRHLVDEGIDSYFIEPNDYPYIVDSNVLKDITARLLCQEMKSILLVGPTGSGKTSLVRHLSNYLLDSRHPLLRHLRILSVNVASLLAGSEYRGSFEKKVISTLDRCQQYDNLVIFFDEAHSMRFTAFREGVGIMDILKPRMIGGNLKMILATTDLEEKSLGNDPAFIRRLHTVILAPLDEKQAKQVARMHFDRLARRYHAYEPAASAPAWIEFEDVFQREMPLHEQIDLMDFTMSRRKLDDQVG